MDEFQLKYLKYKTKYLKLKKQQGGVVDCDRSTEWGNFLYNLWRIACRILYNDYHIDCDNREWLYNCTSKQSERGDCEFLVWNELYPNLPYDKNHLNLSFTRDNQIRVIVIKNNIEIAVEYFGVDINKRLEEIGHNVAENADRIYRRYFPC